MQPIPPSRESLSQILYSPPPTATSSSECFAFQAQPELTQPSSHNWLQPLVVEYVTSPISPISFKQPGSTVPNNIPVQYAPQQPFQQPTSLKPPESKQYVSQECAQPSSSQALSEQQVLEQSYKPKYPPSDCLQQHTSQLPPHVVLALPELKLPVSLSASQSSTQPNADQLQHLSHQLLEVSELSTKLSPQQLSIQSHELPPDDHDQSPQLSPQLHQLSRQSSGSDLPLQSPPPSPHEPVSLSPPPPPPNLPPPPAQSPQQTRYTPLDVLKLKTKDDFKILLFRITTYLGFLFDGQPERKHYGNRLATYHIQRHGATLQITDTFGPDLEIKRNHESLFPDLILMCLPLTSDVGIRRRENSTLLVMKKSYENYIWQRVVIALTVPDPEKNEITASTAAILKRQDDIEKFMKSLRIPIIPPFIYISDTPFRDMLSDPKPTWYTELWSAIFKHCSDAGCPTLHVHLTDRLTGISATTRSCLPKIPKESIKILEKRIEELQNAKDTAQANINTTAH